MTGEDATDGHRATRPDRRRAPVGDGSPLAVLAGMPALTMLGRLSMPMLAVTRDGVIVYANEAFADMLGYPSGAVSDLTLEDCFESDEQVTAAVADAAARSDTVVRLRHADGFMVRAAMSRSVLLRASDPVLIALHDLTELWWLEGR